MHDPSYALELKQTLTVKPKNFRIHVTRRSGKAIVTGHQNGGESTARSPGPIAGLEVSGSIGAQPLYVFYGSNTGSSEAFAQKIATNAAANGQFSLPKAFTNILIWIIISGRLHGEDRDS
jgi:cytochrome P450 / NADPH-cytochrome P450 reductase